MYEKSAVDDPQRFERQYASTKAAIQVNDGAIAGGQIQPKAQAALPTGYENVYDIANSSLGEVTGINKEFLGSSENRQVSALMEAQRINQASSVLAIYFDANSLCQIESARLMLTWMAILADNRPRHVTLMNPDGTSRTELITPELFMKEYDIKITEAKMPTAQQAETGQVLLGIAQSAAMMGKDIFPVVVDYIPGLKHADKKRLQQILNPEPSPEAMRSQEQIERLNLMAQQARIDKDVAEASYKLASVDTAKANTARTLVEADQKNMENQLMKKISPENVSVGI
jgi:hypothetical protein